MYTVIWTEDGKDRWDRFETKEEVKELLNTLEDTNVCIEDIWVFSYEADDYAVTGDIFIN